MTAQDDAPEAPLVVPRRVVRHRVFPSGEALGPPGRRRKPRLVWNRNGSEGAHTGAFIPVDDRASGGTIPEPPLRFPKEENASTAEPVIAYLLTAFVFGITGFALGMSLFGTALAAFLAYLGAGFVGILGLALLLFWRQR